jgi:predicted Holliday junction resolvase-like endonuclease
MEIYIIIFLSLVIVYFIFAKAAEKPDTGELEKLKREIEVQEMQLNVYIKMAQDRQKTVPEETHNKALRERQDVIEYLKKEMTTLQAAGAEIAEQLRQEKSRTKSEQVRMGLIGENLLPFLEGFPYDRKLLTVMLKPIDFLFFGEKEIVFLEIKTGNAQLTQKQKNIKEIVEKKNVRFEVWQINEQGVNKK